MYGSEELVRSGAWGWNHGMHGRWWPTPPCREGVARPQTVRKRSCGHTLDSSGTEISRSILSNGTVRLERLIGAKYVWVNIKTIHK